MAEALLPGEAAAAALAGALRGAVRKRLREPAEPVARFLGRATGLGDRLGPVLVQLPPNLRADPDALDATLRLFPGDPDANGPPHRRGGAGRNATGQGII
ncbi:DUF72 domain-containing protein [Micromonospora sp. NPDC005806]|uniref:DUF72 domain-containing protein n=1 Tax=Micromonospora sp. NPDC005806 TaxID=3364234 RepID=UPI00367D6903